MINDVSRAFFEADCHRTVCIELPNEDKTHQDVREDNVGMLLKSLYGTRDAAANFQKEVSKFMRGIGFTVGRYNPSTYYHQGRDIKTFVHGDDFVTSASQDNCQWLKSKLEGRFDIKTSILDPMKT